MALSKPIYSLVGTYLEQLFNHPVRTKSITACFLATSANVTSQRMAGAKKLNQHSVFAYALFGLLFGGSVPHYFYQTVERLISHKLKFRKFLIFLAERLVHAPIYQLLSLYSLSLFEGNSHDTAVKNVEKLFWPVLKANWRYLSIFVYLNIAYVPVMFRPLTMGIIAFIWVVYVARKRRRFQETQEADKATKSA
ncbi:peroxisomal membrane protein 2 [Drosophila grimshawi]|uniref:GH15958 n=1 Tax=Drosophila grimshawi TaxID=7222 RepID=B4J1X6_DROGR|nr:peroxisomal membrane protein 2 [Drosophila grimshawi]EDV95901.1 GH15958 [Drosophila grimshawi]